MTGENDEAGSDVNQQEFRFLDLQFADPTHNTNYANFQRQIQNYKTLHSKYITKSKTDLGNTLKKPKNDTLLRVIEMEKKYITSQSKIKVDKMVELNKEFSAFVANVAFEDAQIQGFETRIDKENRDALTKHIALIEDLDAMTAEFQIQLPDTATSSGEGTSSSPRYINRPDLAEGCTSLTEEMDYKATIEFLENVVTWFKGSWPGCQDKDKMKREIFNKLSTSLKTELVEFNVEENTYDDLRNAIMKRIERKYPSKVRVLAFLNNTKQQPTQTLTEYLTHAHREADNAGLYSQKWSVSDLEVMVILAGMKDMAQHKRLLLAYSDSKTITFQEALNFSMIEEAAERQAIKGKQSTSINALKKGEKTKKSTKPATATAPTPPERRQKCGKCPSNRHKTEECTSTLCSFCNRWWHTADTCKINPNSPVYDAAFAAEKAKQQKDKPTAKIQSIQHANRHQTNSQAVTLPPAQPAQQNLFQDRAQLHTPPNYYLPVSPAPVAQPAPVTAAPQPQPGPSNQFPDLDLQGVIDLVDESDGEDQNWSSQVRHLRSITNHNQPSTKSPMHRGLIYYEDKSRGQVAPVLFETGSIVNVIPLSLIHISEPTRRS